MRSYPLCMSVIVVSLISACPSASTPSPIDASADEGAADGAAMEVDASDVPLSPDPGAVTDAGGADPGGTDASAPTDTAEPSDAERMDLDVPQELNEDGGADVSVDAPGSPGQTPTVWGPILGEACGALGPELASSEPSFHVTTWVFEVATFDPSLLEPGPKKRFDQPNAGGSSKCSEVMSLTWLIACQGAELYKTETEILYDTAGAITDYAASVDEEIIGVSVTRAYLGPFNTDYTSENAVALLTDKLAGVNASTANVSASDVWKNTPFTSGPCNLTWMPTRQAAWVGLDGALKADSAVQNG